MTTLMAERMKEAGIERDALYLGAVEALRRADGNIERAVGLLREAVVNAARDMKSGQKPGSGHVKVDSQRCRARDNSERGGGREAGDTRVAFAPAPLRPIDRLARSAAAIAVRKAEATAFDVFHEKYGLDLRRIQKHELVKLASKHRVIARVVEAIERHAPSADPFAYVHDLIKPADLDLFIRQAEARNDD